MAHIFLLGFKKKLGSHFVFGFQESSDSQLFFGFHICLDSQYVKSYPLSSLKSLSNIYLPFLISDKHKYHNCQINSYDHPLLYNYVSFGKGMHTCPHIFFKVFSSFPHVLHLYVSISPSFLKIE